MDTVKVKRKYEVEQGSSDETFESVSNVSSKPFSNIITGRLVQQKLMEGPRVPGPIINDQISGIVQLPSGHVVVVVQPIKGTFNQNAGSDRYLKILDKGLETKLCIDTWSKLQQPHETCNKSKINIALFDGRRVAASISCVVPSRGHGGHVNILHVLSVFPNIEIGQEIKLKYTCELIACSNNKIYCYSPDLNKSTLIACPGVEMMSLNGEVLTTIQLFDQVSCFCPSVDGGIIYFGNREVDGCKTEVFRRVTKDNVEVFSHACVEKPIYATADKAGNLIVLTLSGNVIVLNPDGSRKRVLLHQNYMAVTDEDRHSLLDRTAKEVVVKRQQTAIHFSENSNILLVAGLISLRFVTSKKIYAYKLEFSK